MGFRVQVWGLGFKFLGLMGFGVQGFLGLWGLGFKVSCRFRFLDER